MRDPAARAELLALLWGGGGGGAAAGPTFDGGAGVRDDLWHARTRGFAARQALPTSVVEKDVERRDATASGARHPRRGRPRPPPTCGRGPGAEGFSSHDKAFVLQYMYSRSVRGVPIGPAATACGPRAFPLARPLAGPSGVLGGVLLEHAHLR